MFGAGVVCPLCSGSFNTRRAPCCSLQSLLCHVFFVHGFSFSSSSQKTDAITGVGPERNVLLPPPGQEDGVRCRTGTGPQIPQEHLAFLRHVRRVHPIYPMYCINKINMLDFYRWNSQRTMVVPLGSSYIVKSCSDLHLPLDGSVQ